MSRFEDKRDNVVMECPYCNDSYIPDRENYTESEREEQCASCGKNYIALQEFEVHHVSVPDCSINNEEHKWEKVQSNVGSYSRCTDCGAILELIK